MDDDLNVSVALAAVFRLAKQVNRPLEEGSLGSEGAQIVLEFLRKVNGVLEVLDLDADAHPGVGVLELVERREKARALRQWQEADRLREELSRMGVRVVDTPSGTLWRRERLP
jgi:cysteinyl-tRNA synthetase